MSTELLALPLLDNLAFCRYLIQEVLRSQDPDPLTEVWRPIPDFPNYVINRAGEIMNQRGDLLKTRQAHLERYAGYDAVALSHNGTQSWRAIPKLLRTIFADDYR